MNIAELFVTIGVKADTAKLENVKKKANEAGDGLKNASGKTGEFVNKLKPVAGKLGEMAGGLKNAAGRLNEFASKMKDAAQQTGGGLLKLAGLSIGIGAAVAGLKKITSAAMETAGSVRNLSAETGVSAESIQTWTAVADQVNGSGQSVQSAISAIAKNREAMKTGGGNLKPYALLGINPNQDPIAVLEELRGKTAGMSAAMKAQTLGDMGLSSDLIPVLETGSAKFNALAGSAAVMSGSMVNSMNTLQTSLGSIGQQFKRFGYEILAGMLPHINRFVAGFNKWLKSNPAIITALRKIGEWVGRFITMIGDVAEAIDFVVRSSIGWENALKGIIAVIAILNASFLTSPIGLFIAAIILLFLIIQDLWYFMKSKTDPRYKSLFGSLAAKNPEMEKAMDGLFGWAKELGQIFKDLWDKLKSDVFPKLQAAFLALWNSLKNSGIIQWFLDLIKVITDNFMKALEDVIGMVKAISVAMNLWKAGEHMKSIEMLVSGLMAVPANAINRGIKYTTGIEMPTYKTSDVADSWQKWLDDKEAGKVNDAIVAPGGKVITTSPADWIIATKDIGGLADALMSGGRGMDAGGYGLPVGRGGGISNIINFNQTNNITGGDVSGKIAERTGDTLAAQLRRAAVSFA